MHKHLSTRTLKNAIKLVLETMSKISQRAGKKRFAIIIGLGATVAAAWLILRPPGIDQTGEEIVSAEVLEVIQRKPPSGSPLRVNNGLVIAVVELPDGGRARVFAPRSRVSMGAKIPVKVKHYSDGSRHITGGGGELAETTHADP